MYGLENLNDLDFKPSDDTEAKTLKVRAHSSYEFNLVRNVC